ncbi:32337_t:CDS:1, partial [Racocetra persica]
NEDLPKKKDNHYAMSTKDEKEVNINFVLNSDKENAKHFKKKKNFSGSEKDEIKWKDPKAKKQFLNQYTNPKLESRKDKVS